MSYILILINLTAIIFYAIYSFNKMFTNIFMYKRLLLFVVTNNCYRSMIILFTFSIPNHNVINLNICFLNNL